MRALNAISRFAWGRKIAMGEIGEGSADEEENSWEELLVPRTTVVTDDGSRRGSRRVPRDSPSP